MAKKRMFSIDVVDTDAFLDLTLEAQCLYFHLGMRADDDGFVASPRKILRTVGCGKEHLDELIEQGFVLSFSTGIIVITDWKRNNDIKKDRYTETLYRKEKETLSEIDRRYFFRDSEQTNPPDS